MWQSKRFCVSFSIFLMLGGLVILVTSILVYLEDSNGNKNALVEGGFVLLAGCLFWTVGGLLGGRSIFKSTRWLTGKTFVATFILIIGALQISVSLHSVALLSEPVLYLARNSMLGGWSFWMAALSMYRGLVTSQ
jgi:hypothetical protein